MLWVPVFWWYLSDSKAYEAKRGGGLGKAGKSWTDTSSHAMIEWIVPWKLFSVETTSIHDDDIIQHISIGKKTVHEEGNTDPFVCKVLFKRIGFLHNTQPHLKVTTPTPAHNKNEVGNLVYKDKNPGTAK